VKVGNFVFEGVAGGVQVSFSLLKKKRADGVGRGAKFFGLSGLTIFSIKGRKGISRHLDVPRSVTVKSLLEN